MYIEVYIKSYVQEKIKKFEDAAEDKNSSKMHKCFNRMKCNQTQKSTITQEEYKALVEELIKEKLDLESYGKHFESDFLNKEFEKVEEEEYLEPIRTTYGTISKDVLEQHSELRKKYRNSYKRKGYICGEVCYCIIFMGSLWAAMIYIIYTINTFNSDYCCKGCGCKGDKCDQTTFYIFIAVLSTWAVFECWSNCISEPRRNLGYELHRELYDVLFKNVELKEHFLFTPVQKITK